MLMSSTTAAAALLLTGGLEALEAVGLQVGVTIQPMLAASAPGSDAALDKIGLPAVVDYKLDGLRVQVHRAGEEVRIFTRSLDDISAPLRTRTPTAERAQRQPSPGQSARREELSPVTSMRSGAAAAKEKLKPGEDKELADQRALKDRVETANRALKRTDVEQIIDATGRARSRRGSVTSRRGPSPESRSGCTRRSRTD
jgi:hypothetical protein